MGGSASSTVSGGVVSPGAGTGLRTLAAAGFAAVVAVLVAAALFLLGCTYVRCPSAFNSDHLYCTAFCEDLRLGRPLAGWCLPGAPYLFPDMALMLPCQFLPGGLVSEFLGYLFVLFACLLAAVAWLGRSVGLSWRQAFAAAASGVLLLVAAHLGQTYEGRGTHLASPGSHLGIVPVGLALLALAVGLFRRGPRPLAVVLFLTLGSLGAVSDKLLLVQFLAPLSAALVLLACCRVVTGRQVAGMLGLIGGVVLLDVAIRGLLASVGVHFLRVDSDFGGIKPGDGAALLGQVRDGVAGQTLLMVLMHLYLLAGFLLMAAWLRRRGADGNVCRSEGRQECLSHKGVLAIALTLMLSPACNLAALFVTGMSRSPAVNRYTLPCYVFPLLLTGWLLALLPGRGARLGRVLFPVLAVLFAAWRLAERGPELAAVKLEPPYPPLARVIDRLAREHGPLRGLGGHWTARQMTYLTREHVPIRSISNSGSARPHACSLQGYLCDDRHDTSVPDYQLVILSSNDDKLEPTPEAIRCEYGEPLERLVVGSSEVWRYRRVESRKWETFLRAQLAQRLRNEWEYIAPVEPKKLRNPKHDRTPWDRSCNVLLPRGQSLEVRFDPPATGSLLDVSAHFLDQFRLAFYRGADLVGTARVPAVLSPGFTYGPPGLQSRLVPLPAACREKPWDRVVMTPLVHYDCASIGHFLVYRQELPYRYPHAPAPGQQRRYEGEVLPPWDLPAIRAVPDPSASGGQVRRAAAGYSGLMACGPYTFLPPGRYRVDFTLAVAEKAAGAVTTIAVATDCGLKHLRSRELDGSDFAAPGGFGCHSITLDVAEELDGVEFLVSSTGKTAVSLDCIDLTRLEAPDTSRPEESHNLDLRSSEGE
jgi:hypothetical protein